VADYTIIHVYENIKILKSRLERNVVNLADFGYPA